MRMWILVFFDLPVKTKKQRTDYTKFRKKLLQCGFHMRQFSVYEVHCATTQVATQYTEGIRKAIPKNGKISLFRLSDATCSTALHWSGQVQEAPSLPRSQLTLF